MNCCVARFARTPKHTAREVFSGKNQIRKVHSTDSRGGGEESRAISGDHAFSGNVFAAIMPEAKTGGGTNAKPPPQLCASGDGAADTTQQVLPAFETATGGCSACTIAMCSHFVFVCGVAHSLARECIAAQ